MLSSFAIFAPDTPMGLYDQSQHQGTEVMIGTVSVSIVTRFPDVGPAKQKLFPFRFKSEWLRSCLFTCSSVCAQVSLQFSSVPNPSL